jgi:hypothetical protein
MKMKVKTGLIAVSTLALAAGSAYALETTASVVLSPYYTSEAAIDVTAVDGSVATTVNLSAGEVAAVEGAQQDALAVAQGAPATDVFNNGRAALEQAANVKFPTTEKAALAILDIDSRL